MTKNEIFTLMRKSSSEREANNQKMHLRQHCMLTSHSDLNTVHFPYFCWQWELKDVYDIWQANNPSSYHNNYPDYLPE